MKVIRNTGDPHHARTLAGIPVQRESKLFLRSYKQWFPVLQTSMHFCFLDYTQPRGSTLFCTCGAPAVIVGYEAYRKYNSYVGNEVIVCHNFIQYGKHADGSHE